MAWVGAGLRRGVRALGMPDFTAGGRLSLRDRSHFEMTDQAPAWPNGINSG